jgi:hypothetical protein|tara:strand:- start:145 stop:342 length:198 start_codon:yes stop_codon:yes gene_type:complete
MATSSKPCAKSKANEARNCTKPALRKRLFNEIKAGGKGVKPGQGPTRKTHTLAKTHKPSSERYRS